MDTLYDTSIYQSTRDWFDSEDVIAGLSLPMIEMLSGRSPRFRDFIMGFVNQIVARNAVAMATKGKTNAVTLHSLKSLVAGALVSLESYLLQRKSLRTEGFFRELSRGTVASLIAGAIGPVIGERLPDKA